MREVVLSEEIKRAAEGGALRGGAERGEAEAWHAMTLVAGAAVNRNHLTKSGLSFRRSGGVFKSPECRCHVAMQLSDRGDVRIGRRYFCCRRRRHSSTARSSALMAACRTHGILGPWRLLGVRLNSTGFLVISRLRNCRNWPASPIQTIKPRHPAPASETQPGRSDASRSRFI